MNEWLAYYHLPQVIHLWVDDKRFLQIAHIKDYNNFDEG
jgi:hypothetical protein